MCKGCIASVHGTCVQSSVAVSVAVAWANSCMLQIIDMGLEEKSAAVLGAALVWQDGQDKLLVLVPDQLLVYTIEA